MRVIGYSIVSKSTGKAIKTTSSRPSSKIYTTEGKAKAILAAKRNPIVRIMEKYPMQAARYQTKLDEVDNLTVVPVYIFESDVDGSQKLS